MAGYSVQITDVTAVSDPGDTAATRVTIDDRVGAEQLTQRVISFGRGVSKPRVAESRDEIGYVLSGSGMLHLEGDSYPLEPDTGFYVRAGERFTIENDRDDDLEVVSVTAPEPTDGELPDQRKVTVRVADQKVLPAGKDREFRFVIDPDAGCRDVTQFVGWIPPGRAPTHYHKYDEVIYVIDGTGVLHIEGRPDTPIEPGTCIHLPPPTEHCLENTGTRPLRVLGVFHPAGDASEAYEDNA